MWNFGIPSALKAWIDLVVRPGRTFRYADGGVLGLAKGKRAILVLASGGVFTEGPWRPWDFVEPYLRQILGFIGIVDVQTVRAEGMTSPRWRPTLCQRRTRLSRSLRCRGCSRPIGTGRLAGPPRYFRLSGDRQTTASEAWRAMTATAL